MFCFVLFYFTSFCLFYFFFLFYCCSSTAISISPPPLPLPQPSPTPSLMPCLFLELFLPIPSRWPWPLPGLSRDRTSSLVSRAGYCWKSWRLKDIYFSVTPWALLCFPRDSSLTCRRNPLHTHSVSHFHLSFSSLADLLTT